MTKLELEQKYSALSKAFVDIYWMAQRYADGRSTYAVQMFNEAMRTAIEQGLEMKPPRFARDSGGRMYDRLSSEELKEAGGEFPFSFLIPERTFDVNKRKEKPCQD